MEPNNETKKVPRLTILKVILNNLAECHVQGRDSYQFGNALKALEQVIVEEESQQEEPKNESDVQ